VSGVYATNSCLQGSSLLTKILGVPSTGSYIYLACNTDLPYHMKIGCLSELPTPNLSQMLLYP